MALLILGLVLFVFLVVLHEYGHFLVAKRNGVEVEEFGIGFPPKLYGKRLGKGVFKGYYSINLLPLGGFVKLKGEHDYDTQPGTFGAAPLPAKVRIMLAGVSVNLVIALVMMTIVAWIGMPQLVQNQFTVKSDSKIIRSEVIANFIDTHSPAEKAGLKNGDIIKNINKQPILTEQGLRNSTKSLAGQTVSITYERGGKTIKTKASLLNENVVAASLSTDNPKGYLGVGMSEYQLNRSTWSAPIVAAGVSTQLTALTFKALGGAIASLGKSLASAVSGHGRQAKQEASAASQNVAGPVGIYTILKQGSILGYQFILFVVALISLTLAIMNVLPIPALDGGRAFVMLLFRLIKKPLLPKTEELIHGTGFALLILLFITITIVDIKRFY
ncbi:MAG TPA: M50 family metallopeptidase [Patescibacteria group bacterium]|nr:M50 family metallopeptidase [Patescibacteria group bacterium]